VLQLQLYTAMQQNSDQLNFTRSSFRQMPQLKLQVP